MERVRNRPLLPLSVLCSCSAPRPRQVIFSKHAGMLHIVRTGVEAAGEASLVLSEIAQTAELPSFIAHKLLYPSVAHNTPRDPQKIVLRHVLNCLSAAPAPGCLSIPHCAPNFEVGQTSDSSCAALIAKRAPQDMSGRILTLGNARTAERPVRLRYQLHLQYMLLPLLPSHLGVYRLGQGP